MPITQGPDRVGFRLGSPDIATLGGDDLLVLEPGGQPSRRVAIDGGDGIDTLDLRDVRLAAVMGDTPGIIYIRDLANAPGTGEVARPGLGAYLSFDDVETIRINAADRGLFDLRELGHGVRLFGGDVGNSFVGGAAFADRFFGGAGEDRFDIGVGDIASGRGGADSFTVRAGDRFDVFGGDGIDTITITGATTLDLARGTMINGGVTNRVTSVEKVFISVQPDYRADVYGSNGNDTIIGLSGDGSSGVLSAWGRGGSDQLRGNGYLNGGAGSDLISGTGTLLGGSGNDRIGAGVGTIVFGGTGDDTIFALSGARVSGGDGNDVIEFEGGSVIRAGAGIDQLIAKGNVRDANGVSIFMDAADLLDLSRLDANRTTDDLNDAFRLVFDPAQTPVAGALLIERAADGGWLLSGHVDGDGMADFTMTVRAPQGWWIDGLIL